MRRSPTKSLLIITAAVVVHTTIGMIPAAGLAAPTSGKIVNVPGRKPGPKKVTTVEGIAEYRLANGMQVLLFPDPSKATVTVNVTYFVGSRHEGYGESGMAHLLEHMLFKGTPTHPDVWKLLQDHGAKFNGTTWYDRTNYYEELPASPQNLEFALRLEADRMLNSKIAEEDLKKEFSVVRNEFEMGENNPAGVLEEKMMSVAYQWHNYGKTTIGSRADIERVPISSLRAFYKKFYRPDNAMLVVAGKFEPEPTLALVQQIFGALPKPAEALPKTYTEEPVQDGERSVTLRRTGDVSVVAVLYHGLAGSHPDWIAEDALIDVLTNKPAGRLYKALVEKGLASEVYGYVYPTAEPGVMYFGAKVRTGGSPEKVRDVMLKTVEGLSTGVTEVEVARWRARAEKEFELALTETSSVGVALSDWAAMGDWRLFFLTRDRVKGVQPDDVMRVAKNFLKSSNRTVGMFIPDKTPDRAPQASNPDVVAMMKDYKGSEGPSQGEVFVATPDSVEARTKRSKLDGGLQLALLPKKTKGGAVRLLLTVRYGSEKELTGKTAAAALVPQMLLRGTKKRTFQQLKDELDRLKAEVSFGNGGFSANQPGITQVRVKTTRENLPAVVALLGEVLREPAFPKTEFETLRKELLSRLEEQLQDPMANGFVTLLQGLLPWPPEDVRHVPTMKESIERLQKLTLPELTAMHKRLWGTHAAQLAVVGDFDEAELTKQLQTALGSWKAAQPYDRIERPFRDSKPSEQAVETPDKQMAFIGVGHPVQVRDDDPAYPALIMVNHILGGSASSRLLERLRQKEGLSYGAFSNIEAPEQDDSGYFFAGAIAAPENADKAMAALMQELEKLLKDGVSDKELADAKKSYALTFENRMAEDDFVATELAQGLWLGRTFAYWKAVNDKIQKLTAPEVNAAAKKFLQTSKLGRVKAGDLKKSRS